jgi:hypothetical protein
MAQKLLDATGQPILRENKEIFISEWSLIRSIDVENRTMSMVGTDESVDRDGDIISLAGWQLDNYKKNPVFLWAHDYHSVPLARAERIIKRRDPAHMEFFLKFPTKGIYPFADMILELYGEKVINTSSVGFIPFEWEALPENDPALQGMNMRYPGRKYTKQELLELSGCAVPSNPNALANAVGAKVFGGVPGSEMIKWFSGIIPDPKNSDDILGEIMGKGVEYVDETKVIVQVPKAYDLVKCCDLEQTTVSYTISAVDAKSFEELCKDSQKINITESEDDEMKQIEVKFAEIDKTLGEIKTKQDEIESTLKELKTPKLVQAPANEPTAEDPEKPKEVVNDILEEAFKEKVGEAKPTPSNDLTEEVASELVCYIKDKLKV